MGTRVVKFVETKADSGLKVRVIMSCGVCANGATPLSSPKSPCNQCLGATTSKFKLAPEYKKCEQGAVEVPDE